MKRCLILRAEKSVPGEEDPYAKVCFCQCVYVYAKVDGSIIYGYTIEYIISMVIRGVYYDA